MDDIEGDYMEWRSHLRAISQKLSQFAKELAVLEMSFAVRPPTTDPSTQAGLSDVTVPGRTTLPDRTFSRSATRTDDVGPAAPGSWCARVDHTPDWNRVGWHPADQNKAAESSRRVTTCRDCDVLLELAWTPVPAAGPAGSISARAGSPSSAATSEEESAPSRSKWWCSRCSHEAASTCTAAVRRTRRSSATSRAGCRSICPSRRSDAEPLRFACVGGDHRLLLLLSSCSAVVSERDVAPDEFNRAVDCAGTNGVYLGLDDL